MKYTKYKLTLCMKCNLRYMCLDGKKRCAKTIPQIKLNAEQAKLHKP